MIAGAGSGKTRVLTYKIAYLLQQGVSPYHILALTFTNKAAREMKSRIATMVGEKQARYLWMGTFHSIFSRILRQEATLLGFTHDFTIYDTTDSKSLIKQIIKDLGEDDKVYKVGDVLGRISEAKNLMQSPRDYMECREYTVRDRAQRHYRLGEMYQLYQQRLRQSNAMDFDDLLFNMNVLLKHFPEVREKYQNYFEYILVDEYQDTNYSQYLIVKTLAAVHQHICVVGDDAQSIYSFRGADIRNILMFQSEYPEAPMFKLERNYRSTQNIVGAANSLIHHNRAQIHKDVYSENGVGDPLCITSHATDRDEAKYVAEKAYLLHGLDSRSYDDFAVLYRTNAQSRVLEDELRKVGIPYRIYGGTSFYQRKEIKDALAYCRLLVNPDDNEAFLRVVNYPTRGIGDTTVKKLREQAIVHNLSFFAVAQHPVEYGLPVSAATQKKLIQFAYIIEQLQAALPEKDAYDMMVEIMQKTGIMTAANMDKTVEGLDRAENLKELQSAIHEFVEKRRELGDDGVTLADFLSEVSLLTDQDEHQDDTTARLTLMTIHAAKGLEYGVVFIVGLEKDLFPSQFCQTEKELEEERRLFYVAITRAKEKCFISSARQRFRNGQILVPSPSPFLKDIDARFTQVIASEQRAPRQDAFRSSLWDDEPSFTSSPRASLTPAPARLKPLAARVSPLEGGTGGLGFTESTRVNHAVFGDGTVLQSYIENGNEKVDILFDKSGKKTLLVRFAKLTVLN